MKIKIPIAVAENGEMVASFIRDRHGREHQDEMEMLDDMSNCDVRNKLLHVTVEIDLEKLFPPDGLEIQGEVE